MKTKIFLFIALFFLVACNTHDNKQKDITPSKTKFSILSKVPSKYVDWYVGNSESIVLYDYVEYPYLSDRSLQINERNTEDNTIMFNEEVGIRLHDSYTVDNDGKVAHFHINRKASLVNSKRGTHARYLVHNEDTTISPTYDIDVQMVEPIFIYRPASTPCYCIPLCYYENMEIEWNQDVNNTDGILIITEWNGVTMNGTSSETETIIGIDFVEDNGVTTLDNAIFEGMPDEALVNLWLIRANVVTVEEIGAGYINDIIQWGMEDPDLVAELLEDEPELLTDLQTMTVATGAVALLSFYLIREL